MAKQHVQIAYVITERNGQSITKMFMRNNGGTERNGPGYHDVRFQMPKDYVKALPIQS